ncbi:hypothetical protein M8494_12955 [Serratia ureilytica]
MRTYFEKPRTVVGWKGLISGSARWTAPSRSTAASRNGAPPAAWK